MVEVFRVGIVGMGDIGKTHARAMAQVEGLELVAYSGGGPASGQECGWPDARQLSHEEIVVANDIDIVALCSPSQLHGPAAIALAKLGRHVVVEKPLALSVSQAQELVSLSGLGTSIIAMVAQRRFEPVYAAVKQLLEQGDLGTIRLATTQVHWHRGQDYFNASPWRSQKESGGGSLVNQGVHNIDLLQWLCGPIAAVTAQTATLGLPVQTEDTVVATARFESGALGLISTSTALPPGRPATVTVYTDKGMVELGQGEILSWEIPDVPRPQAPVSAGSGASNPAAIGLVGHIAVWKDIVAAIRGGRQPLVDAIEGANVTRLICGIYEAAESGREVTLAQL